MPFSALFRTFSFPCIILAWMLVSSAGRLESRAAAQDGTARHIAGRSHNEGEEESENSREVVNPSLLQKHSDIHDFKPPTEHARGRSRENRVEGSHHKEWQKELEHHLDLHVTEHTFKERQDGGDELEVAVLRHTGGGLISSVMADIIDKLPYIPRPPGHVINGTKLMRRVHLSGDYKADVPLVLPSYVTVFLDGSITPTMKLAATQSMPQGNLMAALVLGYKADMLGIEGEGSGALLDCSGWNSTNSTTNTSSLTGIWFESVLGAFVRNLAIRNCGMGAPAGPRPMYASGNIRIDQCFGAAVEGVESYNSYNRGLWSQASRLVVWNGNFHHNLADGIDFDSVTSKSVAYNNTCNDNGRHGIFVEEGASYNVLVNNVCLRNRGNGICLGSLLGPSGTNYNTVLANILGPDNYPGSGGQQSSISFGGSDYTHRQLDLVAVGNVINGNVASHGNIDHGVFVLNTNIESYEDFNIDRANDSLWLNNP